MCVQGGNYPSTAKHAAVPTRHQDVLKICTKRGCSRLSPNANGSHDPPQHLAPNEKAVRWEARTTRPVQIETKFLNCPCVFLSAVSQLQHPGARCTTTQRWRGGVLLPPSQAAGPYAERSWSKRWRAWTQALSSGFIDFSFMPSMRANCLATSSGPLPCIFTM